MSDLFKKCINLMISGITQIYLCSFERNGKLSQKDRLLVKFNFSNFVKKIRFNAKIV